MNYSTIKNEYDIKELIDLYLSGYKFYLYGAGGGASSYDKISIAALAKINIKPIAFLDDDFRKQGIFKNEIKIINPDALVACIDPIVIIISSNYFESIIKKITSLKINNIYIFTVTSLLRNVDPFAFNEIMEYAEVQRRIHMHNAKFIRIKNQNLDSNSLNLNIVDIQVTERCTMKCLDCSNLMQYYEKPINADAEILEFSIINLLDAVDEISEIRILGGEPFLYKNLNIIIDLFSNNKKVDKVIIYTNATFIPNYDTLNSMINGKILVEITDYVGQSKKKEEFILIMQKLGINYICHEPQNWTDSARIINNDKSEKELNSMFEKCCVNDVLTLLHGKIYHCPFSANVHNLRAIPTDIIDFVDVYNQNNTITLKNRLKKFYFGLNYLNACKVCLGRDFTQDEVIPALQTKKAIPIPIISFKQTV